MTLLCMYTVQCADGSLIPRDIYPYRRRATRRHKQRSATPPKPTKVCRSKNRAATQATSQAGSRPF